MSAPDELTTEQADRLVRVALEGFRNGYMTALAVTGMPRTAAAAVSAAVAQAAYADPIARNYIADHALATYLDRPCEHAGGIAGIPVHLHDHHDRDGDDQ